jgi:predicted alpha/beta-fold hydrolase
MRDRLAGHYWTLAPFLRNLAAPRTASPSVDWQCTVEDPRFGPLRLTGKLSAPDDATRLLLIVHGLGGHAESHYMAAATHAAQALGIASLRLNLRGADRLGEDYYHAALTSDLADALTSPELARFENIYVLGYSLGGHVTLRLATEKREPRLRAVAAVCAPLELGRSAEAFDRPERFVYRAHVLRGLFAMYRGVAAKRQGLPLSVKEAERIRSIREWDDRVVAPRHGFRNADHYYYEASVGRRLGALTVPALLVVAENDPMVPAETVRPALNGPPQSLDVRWVRRGGHVGFPDDVDLGPAARNSRDQRLESQVVGWLLEHGARAGR